MPNVRILRGDPFRLSPAELSRINIDRQSVKVTIFGCAKERRQHWIFRAEIVSEWRQHPDESVDPICQRKNAEFVEDPFSVRDAGKQPENVTLINTLREKSNDLEDVMSVGAEFLEHRGGQ